ncbi:MAG TPA: heme ABC exporter ATP-binding protein CcmA [Candidatus Polarisedimenticolia bacterium]|nr:heme ABC exporter ATP-binding protein CcmA [Candidatus Polarisedimenticolia bacterium]
MSAPFVEAKGLEFGFGLRPVLRGVSLTMRPGESMALFGPNGAGKTTLLRILASLLRPLKGEIAVDGNRLAGHEDRRRWRARIGFLSHHSMLYERLTGRENLLFYARMYGARDTVDRCGSLFAQVGLSGREDDLVGSYSRGMQQRLAVARALVNDPDLLLLDEPFSGLDPQAAASLSILLRKRSAAGKAILFTSHDLRSGYEAAERVAILSGGVLAYQSARHEAGFETLEAAYATHARRGA